MSEEQTEQRRTVPFADTLQRLQDGRTARELGEALQQLVAAVEETGRAGTLTLQIKVSKSKASRMVEVLDTWRVKTPELDRPTSLFYIDEEHNLHRKDPIQDELPGMVRAVPDSGPAVQKVGNE